MEVFIDPYRFWQVTCVPDQYYSCGPTADPYWDQVVLMLHCDGTNGSTTFTDASTNTKTVTAADNAKLSTTQKKWGATSGDFDGSGDVLTCSASSDLVFGTGDFTIEAWAWLSSSASLSFYGIAGNGSGIGQFDFHIGNAGGINVLRVYADGGSINFSSGATSIPTNSWMHVACARQGATIAIYLNGVQVGAAVGAGANLNSTAQYKVSSNNLVNCWFGYLDDIRITKGVARYTGNFNIPTAAFPDAQQAGDTLALLTQKSGNIDVTISKPSAYQHRAQAVAGASSFFYAGWAKSSLFGKRYIEFVSVGAGDSVNNTGRGVIIGFVAVRDDSVIPANPFGEDICAVTNLNYNGVSPGFLLNGSTTANATYDFVQNDVISFAYDYATGKVWVRKNGAAWIGGGDPAAGTTPTFTVNTKYMMPYISAYVRGSGGVSGDFNVLARLYADTMSHAVPAGFSSFENRWGPTTTVLSLHAESATDSSCAQPKTVTLTGAASVSSVQRRYGANAFLIPFNAGSNSNGVQIANHQDFQFGAGDWTIEFWAYRLGNTGTARVLLRNAGTNSITLTYNGTTGFLATCSISTSAGTRAITVTAVAFPANQWDMFVLQRRGTALELYVDGVLAGSNTAITGAETWNSTADFFFGRDSTATANNTDGHIDEVRITKGVARYQAASQTIPASAFPDSGAEFANVISLLHFNEADGTTIPVDVVSGNTWTNIGASIAITRTASARFGSAGFRHATTGTAGGLRYVFSALANVPFTLEGFIRLTAVGGGGSQFNRFAELIAGSGSSVGLSYNSVTGNLMVLRGGGGYSYDDAAPMALNQWHHFALVDSAVGFRVFLNGVPVYADGRRNTAGNVDYRPDNSGGNGAYYSGDLDEFRLTWGVARYLAAFTPPTMANCDSGGAGPPLPAPPVGPPVFTALLPRTINLSASIQGLLFAEYATFHMNGQLELGGSFGAFPRLEAWASPTVKNGALALEYQILEGSMTDAAPPVGWTPFTVPFTKSAPPMYGTPGTLVGTLLRFQTRLIATPATMAEYTITFLRLPYAV